MKSIYLFLILFSVFSFSLFSCLNKKDNNAQLLINELHIELDETKLSNSFEKVDMMALPRLTQDEYNNLQLGDVQELQGYDTAYLCMGKSLLDSAIGKIITVKVITDGEITEVLLSYDKNGKLIDNLIVAYEDMVEYYCRVSSLIVSDQITIQTINYNYADEDSKIEESCDTTIKKYTISPEFRFLANL